VAGGALAFHEQRLQEKSAQLVRTEFKHPTPRQELTGLTALNPGC